MPPKITFYNTSGEKYGELIYNPDRATDYPYNFINKDGQRFYLSPNELLQILFFMLKHTKDLEKYI